MNKTKIDWCDCTINPVVGCPNGCKYCYAERINKRFSFIPNWKEPQFFAERLKEFYSKKPKSIFVDSMSDVGWWKKEWGDKVFDVMKNNPQHNYIFLTKHQTYPSGFHTIWSSRDFYGLKNIYMGRSIDKNRQYDCEEHFDFISIEPILEPIELSSIKYSLYTKLIIIGAETGNRKGKIIPKKEWIDDIVSCCYNAGVSVFMKESLRKIMGNDFRQDKLLWEIDK